MMFCVLDRDELFLSWFVVVATWFRKSGHQLVICLTLLVDFGFRVSGLLGRNLEVVSGARRRWYVVVWYLEAGICMYLGGGYKWNGCW